MTRRVASLRQRGHLVGLGARVRPEQVRHEERLAAGRRGNAALAARRLHRHPVAGARGEVPARAAAGVVGLGVRPCGDSDGPESRLLRAWNWNNDNAMKLSEISDK